MRTSLLAFYFLATLASSAFADPVCGLLSKVSVIPGISGRTQIRFLRFTFASGQTFSGAPSYTYSTDTGNLLYADPVSAGVVSLLSAAFLNRAKVCYDAITGGVSLQ